MPAWFFEAVASQLGAAGDVDLLIAGDMPTDEPCPVLARVPLDWGAYSEYLLSPTGYAVEYRLAPSDLRCACWADADITVFGGESGLMSAVIESLGDAGVLLEHMRQEFLLGVVEGYAEMDGYFHRLLFPAHREPA